MDSFKISKYNHISEINKVISEQWTSFSDIGKLVSKEDYLYMESEYINTIINICKKFDITFLEINNLEINDFEINTKVVNYSNGTCVPITEIKKLLKLILREVIWCKLKSDKLEFHFGYDYYIYLIVFKENINWQKTVSNSLFIEKCKSPYLFME